MFTGKSKFISTAMIVAVMSLVTITGCNQLGTDAVTGDKPTNFMDKYGTALLSTLSDDYSYAFIASRTVIEGMAFRAGVRHLYSMPAIQQTSASASASDTVKFNGSPLSRLNSGEADFAASLSNLAVDGSNMTWRMAGSSRFSGALQFTIPSPLNMVTMTAPLNGDTVSLSSGFTVTWTQAGSGTQDVVILLSPTTGTNRNLEWIRTIDDGSHTFTSGGLSSLTSGHYGVVIQRGNIVTGTAPDGKKYLALAYTEHEVDVILQ